MKIVLYLNLVFALCCLGCQTNTSDDISVIKNELCFDYSFRNKDGLKFIRFYKDSVVWGDDSANYKSGYETCYEMDDLRPSEKCSGYDVKFSKNYIIVGRHDDDEIGNIFNNNCGVTKMFFSLKNDESISISYIYSIDYENEHLLAFNRDSFGEGNDNYPLIISDFTNKYQPFDLQDIASISGDYEASNKILRIIWEDKNCIISYKDKNGIEIKKIIEIEI